jgi:hypothetical protein
MSHLHRLVPLAVCVALVFPSFAAAAAAAPPAKPDRFAFSVKLGAPVSESAAVGDLCDVPGSDICGGWGFSYDTTAADGTMSLILEGEALIRTSASTRAGLLATLRPGLTLKSRLSGKEVDFGTDMDLALTAQWVPELSDSVTGLVGVRAGVRTLFAGGDVADNNADAEQVCVEARAEGTPCSVGAGPYSGFVAGASIGLGVALRTVGLRFELVWTATDIDHISAFEVGSGSQSALLESSLSDWKRVALMAGVDF